MDPTLIKPLLFVGSLGTLVLGLVLMAFGAVLNKKILIKTGYAIIPLGLIAVTATLASCICTSAHWKEIAVYTVFMLIGGAAAVVIIIFAGMKLEQIFKKIRTKF